MRAGEDARGRAAAPAKNAFQALLQGASQHKRRNSSQGGGGGAAASANKRPRSEHAYVTCPVCSGTIPAAFLELHVAACLDGGGSGGGASGQASATPKGGGGGGARRGSAGSSQQQQQQQQHTPEQQQHQQQEQHRSDSDAPRDAGPHADDGGSGGLKDGPSPPPSPGAAAAADDDTHDGRRARPPAPAARDAFSVLAQAQRVLSQVHVCHLHRAPDGALSVRWWLRGDPSAPTGLAVAWSCASPLSLGRGGGSGTGTGGGAGTARAGAAQVLLQTNVPPGDGAEVSWANAALASNAPGGVGAPRRGGTGANAADASLPRRQFESLLKSSLQKNVRLCRTEAAVRVATAYLKEDASSLLRRLAVIIAEDALLHPALPVVVWCMGAAAKGYTLGGTLANAVLAVVQQVAACGVRDHLPRNTGSWRAPGALTAVDAALPAGAADEAALVKALMARSAFGGMREDTEMLWGYAGYWQARFAGLAAPPPPLHAVRAGAAVVVPLAGGEGGEAQGPGRPKLEAGPLEQQQQQLDGSKGAAAAAAATAERAPRSPWLEFIHQAHADVDGAPAAAAAPRVTLVGPLQRDDIPLSALDHHNSDMAGFLASQPPVRAALESATKNCWGAQADAQLLLQRTLWVYRSGVNRKRHLLDLHGYRVGSGGAGGAGGSSQSPATSEKQQQQQQQQQHDEQQVKEQRPPGASALVHERHLLAVDRAQDAAERQRLAPLWAAVAPLADRWAAARIAERIAL